MTADAHLEMSLRAGRDQRQDMARWLALEILATDDMALQDDVLQEHLILLQDKIEAKIRAAVALPGPAAHVYGDARREGPNSMRSLACLGLADILTELDGPQRLW
jgi:hypothetical protein